VSRILVINQENLKQCYPLPLAGDFFFKRLGMKGKFFYIILTALTCLACGHEQRESNFGTEEECRYDAMQLDGDWEGIVAEAEKSPVKSLSCHKVVLLAQFRLRQIDQNAVMECLANTKEALTSVTGAMMMSDVYMQLGMVNMAQRAAFEAMVKTHDIKDNGRALRRLTETALITGQYDLALKYISILEDNPTHRKWARDMRKAVENPDFIEQIPAYQKIKKTYETAEDTFFL
jgi:hypothetical protein